MTMNVLIFDEYGRLSPLIKSIVGGYDARVSASTELKDARLKLDTALFDCAFINTGDKPGAGSSEQFRALMKESYPFLPMVMVDRKDGDCATDEQTILVIRRPLMTNDIVKAIFKLRQYIGNTHPEKAGRHPPCEAEIVADNERILCACRSMTATSALIECRDADPDRQEEFHRFFVVHEKDEMEAVVVATETARKTGRGKAIFNETTPARLIRAVGLVLDGEWQTTEIPADVQPSGETAPARKI